MGREGRDYWEEQLSEVVSDILRTFVSERLQMTNVNCWRSRSKNSGAGRLSYCRGVLPVKNRTDVNT